MKSRAFLCEEQNSFYKKLSSHVFPVLLSFILFLLCMKIRNFWVMTLSFHWITV